MSHELDGHYEALDGQGDFKNLRWKVTPSMRSNYLLRRTVGKILSLIPKSQKILSVFSGIFRSLENVLRTEQQTRQYIKILESNNPKTLEFDSGYGYETEIRELDTAIKYYKELNGQNVNTLRSESGVLYKHVLKILDDLVAKDKEIRKLLDFGVCYGHIVSEVAKRFPHISSYGIDRSGLTKVFNEFLFQDLNNLHIESGDVFDLFKDTDFQKGIFFHSRTLVLLPPSFLDKLYQSVHEAGFKYILGAEQFGISWQTGKPFRLSEEKTDSVVYRNHMFLHNYPEILLRANYRIQYGKILKTNHPDPNLRIFVFLASRLND